MEEVNLEIIRSNVEEALKELKQLLSQIESKEHFSSIELESSLRHAYHHLNFAWNIRNIDTDKYANLTDRDFKEWSKFPAGFDSLVWEEE